MEKENIEVYKRIAKILCSGFRDLPSGCEGCPLFDWDWDWEKNDDFECELEKLESEVSEND